MSDTGSAPPSMLARALIPLGVIILVAVAAAIYLFYLQSAGNPNHPSKLPPASGAPVGPAATNLPDVAPKINPPAVPAAPAAAEAATVTAATTPTPAASAYKSNDEFLDDLQAQGIKGVAALVVREEFARKLAIGIYGLSEGRILSQNRPLSIPEGVFGVAKISDDPDAQYRLLPQNASRYDAYVAALGALDSDLGIRLYQRAYPLLQTAFDELGIGRRSFHQVVILAIDNLLAAPDVTGDLILVKPKLKYTFLDANLEKLPATHKLMLRLGAAHNQTVKRQLRSLRQKLIALHY